jgi:hypothetical protein
MRDPGDITDPRHAEILADAEARLGAARVQLSAECRAQLDALVAMLRLTRDGRGVQNRAVEIAIESARKTVIAFATSYVEAFDKAGLPVDARSDIDGILHAQVVAAGALGGLNGLFGQMDPKTADQFGPLPVRLQLDLESAARAAWLDARELIEEQRKRITVADAPTVPSPHHEEMASPAEAASLVGRKIDELRREAGWSLGKLAEEAGVDRKAPGKHIRGHRNLYPSTVKKYAQALSRGLNRVVTVSELNGGG